MATILARLCGIFSGILILAVRLSGAVAITNPTPYPDAIIFRQTTVVTIKAQLGTDPSLLTASVNVILLNAQNQGVAVLGRLYDDGTHGDRAANDGIYTGQVSLTGSAFASINLAVTAAARGSLQRIRSASFAVQVVKPVTDGPRVSAVQSAAMDLFDTLVPQLGRNEARNSAVAYLAQQPEVSSAGISSDGTTIWIQYADGLRGMILTALPGTSGGAGPGLRFEAGVSHCAPSAAMPGNVISSVIPPAAIVLAPFYGSFSPYDGSYAIGGDLGSTCIGSVTPLVNSEVTVDVLKTLTQYSVIAIYTHGGVGWGPRGDEVAIATGVPWIHELYIRYLDDFLNHRLHLCNVEGTPGLFICALASFFRHYANVEKFPGSLVFANACDTVGTDKGGFNFSLRDAFLDNGAATYLGWKNSVFVDFNGPTEQAYFDYLTNPGIPADQRTTGLAFVKLPNGLVDPKAGEDGSHGTFFIYGDYKKMLCGSSLASTGILYVVNASSSTISAFTIGGNGSLHLISVPLPTGLWPTSLVTDPFGRYAFASTYDSPYPIYMYGISSNTGQLQFVASTFTGENGLPLRLAVDNSGKYIYAGWSFGYSGIVIGNSYDASGFGPQYWGAGSYGGGASLVVDPLNRFVFSGGSYYLGGSAVLSFPLNSQTGVFGIPFVAYAPSTPTSLAVDKLGKHIYGTLTSSNSIGEWTLDPSAGAIAPTYQYAGGVSPTCIVIHPSGKFAYATTQPNLIWAYSIDGFGGLTPLPTSPIVTMSYNLGCLALDGGGSYLYATGTQSNDVSGFAINADGSLTQVPGSPFPSGGTGPNALATTSLRGTQ